MVNKIEDIVCANSRQFCLRRGKPFFFYLYTYIILSVHTHTHTQTFYYYDNAFESATSLLMDSRRKPYRQRLKGTLYDSPIACKIRKRVKQQSLTQ